MTTQYMTYVGDFCTMTAGKVYQVMMLDNGRHLTLDDNGTVIYIKPRDFEKEREIIQKTGGEIFLAYNNSEKHWEVVRELA